MPSTPTRRPNVVCLISDDTDPFNLGCYGGDDFLTPELDRLAAEGMRFARAHAVGAVCTPSRWCYLTGRFPGRCGGAGFLRDNPADDLYRVQWNTDLQPGETNLATMFRAAGYTTGYVGKFHAGRHNGALDLEELPPDHDPRSAASAAVLRRNQEKILAEMRALGWDEPDRVTWGNIDFNTAHNLETHNLEWTAEGALRFLERHATDDAPFLLYVGFHTIHGPKHGENLAGLDPLVTAAGPLEQPPAADMPPRASVLQRLREAGLDPYHRNVGALWMDDAVGAIRRALDRLGLADDTIFIYKADHGKFAKATVYRDGTHVPMIWRWPGHIAPGTRCNALVQNTDFLPTLTDLLGLPVPADYRMDGASYRAQLAGAQSPLRETHFNEMGSTRSAETERWKYVSLRYRRADLEAMRAGRFDALPNHLGRAGADAACLYHAGYYDADQLYEIQQDRGESINLAGQAAYAAVLADMKARLRRHLATFAHPFPEEPDPFQSSDAFRALADRSRALARETTGPDSVFGRRYW